MLLLGVGYLWLAQVGLGVSESPRRASTLTALLYGVAAALTLDEFALWLNLEDMYGTRKGRQSIDATLLFGSLLLIGFMAGHFSARSRARRGSWRGNGCDVATVAGHLLNVQLAAVRF